ncbi:hypothetical protein [Nonomuraea sp. NPDC050691]|uniref:hypothetical protein n=1 Tax=Nonomuraea sp. NPDC050691 TaxID=3155661 RepID=UPI0033D2BE74
MGARQMEAAVPDAGAPAEDDVEVLERDGGDVRAVDGAQRLGGGGAGSVVADAGEVGVQVELLDVPGQDSSLPDPGCP